MENEEVLAYKIPAHLRADPHQELRNLFLVSDRELNNFSFNSCYKKNTLYINIRVLYKK